MSETVTCLHKENIQGNIGTCQLCGQIREYDQDYRHQPKVIKRGRINGVLTEVTPRLQQETPPPATTLKPSNWGQMGLRERKRFYDDHKDEILRDLKEMGGLKTRRKWDIGSGTFSGLQRRWGGQKSYPKRPPVPPKPEGRNLRAIGQYYEGNKEAILQDLHDLGEQTTRKRWHIGRVSWRRLMKKWGSVVGKRQEPQPEPEELTPEEELEQAPWRPHPISKRTGIWGAWSF